MSRVYTYSFESTSVVIEHPDIGSYSAYGTGIGDVSVSMEGNITSHDVAADLAVVVSKHARKNGSVNFNILQSSDFNTFMSKLYNYLVAAAPSKFAQAKISIYNSTTGRRYICTGCSPQKLPDDSYQAQGQNRQWVWMAANIEAQ